MFIKTSYDQNKVRIAIKDTGMGMTEEMVKKLGEPYSSTKGSAGTGLGMMVSFNIIHSMHGMVKVDSTVGKGTTFYITFQNVHPPYQSNVPNQIA